MSGGGGGGGGGWRQDAEKMMESVSMSLSLPSIGGLSLGGSCAAPRRSGVSPLPNEGATPPRYQDGTPPRFETSEARVPIPSPTERGAHVRSGAWENASMGQSTPPRRLAGAGQSSPPTVGGAWERQRGESSRGRSRGGGAEYAEAFDSLRGHVEAPLPPPGWPSGGASSQSPQGGQGAEYSGGGGLGVPSPPPRAPPRSTRRSDEGAGGGGGGMVGEVVSGMAPKMVLRQCLEPVSGASTGTGPGTGI